MPCAELRDKTRFERKVAQNRGNLCAGPPPTPNVIKLLRGNPGKRRIADEPEPQIPECVPEPPVFITGHAC